MIKIRVKSKRKNKNIVRGFIIPRNTNKAELMVVIGKLSELAMKDFGISKTEMVDFIEKRV